VTTENKHFISLDEILSIVFKCTHCQTRISIPLTGSEKLPAKCPSCDFSLLSERRSTEARILDFLRFIADFKTPDPKWQFSFALEIRNREDE